MLQNYLLIIFPIIQLIVKKKKKKVEIVLHNLFKSSNVLCPFLLKITWLSKKLSINFCRNSNWSINESFQL